MGDEYELATQADPSIQFLVYPAVRSKKEADGSVTEEKSALLALAGRANVAFAAPAAAPRG